MRIYVDMWAFTQIKQLIVSVSVPPAANKTADHKELQLCRDRHEDFGGIGHRGEVHTDFVMLRGHSCRKSEGVEPV